MRYAGATGPLTVRADSGFYARAMVAVCRKMDVRFSITVRQHARLRDLIEAIPETDWTPIPYWMDGAADVAETTYTPFQAEPDAAPVRLIVRRVKPTPGSQLALFATYSYHGFITDREGDTLELEADHRRHAEIETPSETSSTAWASTISPPAAFPPTPPGWPYRLWPITWPAGRRASVWESRSLPPRPSGGASSPWPDASPCIFPSTGPRDLAEKCSCQGLYLALTEIAEIADARKAIRSEGTVGS